MRPRRHFRRIPIAANAIDAAGYPRNTPHTATLRRQGCYDRQYAKYGQTDKGDTIQS